MSSIPARPFMVVEPSTGWAALRLGDVWKFRDLLGSLAARDVKLRYRQTALGVAWVLLQPLLAAGAFTFVFGTVAKMDSGATPYFVFSYCGLLGWNFFSGVLTRASGCLVQNSQLISKVYFPRIVLPLSTVASVLLDFAVGFVLLILLMVAYHVHPGIGLIVLPLAIVGMLMLALGVGLYAGALATTYRDVQYVLPFLTQVLLYASPVAYLTTKVPAKFQLAYHLNPMAGLIEAFRWALIGSADFQWRYFSYSLVFSVVTFIAGIFAFKRMERRFADVI